LYIVNQKMIQKVIDILITLKYKVVPLETK